MHIEVRRTTPDDLPSILSLQKIAYQSEAIRYNYFSMQPLTQTLDEIQKEFSTHTFLTALIGDEVVGTVRAVQRGSTCYIGRLAVKPDVQNRGIGRRLMVEIESLFTDVERFELFTGYKSLKNLHLYDTLGYASFGTKLITGELSLTLMEKKRAT